MDTLRIILIVLGLIVIALIYLWERHKNKVNLDKQVVHIPDEDDEPGVMIRISKDSDQDISTDLADLRGFMNERNLSETGFDTDGDRITGFSNDDVEEYEQNKGDSDREVPEQEIVILHIIARDGETISGEALMKSAQSNGLTFGDMNIFHYLSKKDPEKTEPLFSLVNMYEPGVFELDNINEFRTRGVSLFACLNQGKNALEVFEAMLDTARKLADHLDAKLCGPDRQPLDNKTINQIRIRLGGDE